MTYMLTIAEEGGISKAAEKLFISQSALDQQLIKLENELGVQLFLRTRNRFALTPAGEVYMDYAKRIVSLKNEAYLQIHDMADQKKGRLAIAFAPERGMEMFVKVYPTFYQQFPQVTVVPREIGVKRQLEMLQNEELDLCFTSMQEHSIPRVVCEQLAVEEFVLITPLSHALARRAAKPGQPLAAAPAEELQYLTYCLMYPESTQRNVLDPMFKSMGVKPSIFLETASNRANVSMVEGGMCCSIVPYYYAKGNPNIACFRLEPRPAWGIYACYRSGRYKSKAQEFFIHLARQCFQEMMPEDGAIESP